MRYLLDTCVVSDFFEGCKATCKKIRNLRPEELSASVITVAEVEYGILRLNGSKKAMAISEITEELFGSIKIIELNKEIAKMSAFIRRELAVIGKPIGGYDLLIAATAKSNGLIVVTSNIGEFSRIEGIEIENWREE